MNMSNSKLLGRMLVAALPVFFCACSAATSGGSADGSLGPVDAGMTSSDGGVSDGGGPACRTNPQTYLDFVNACTTATTVSVVDSRLPMQYADGGLPPPQTWTGSTPPTGGNCGTTGDAGH